MTAPKNRSVPADTHFVSPEGCIRDRIVVHESSEYPKEGLFVSLNGFPFLIKANEEIDLPRPVRLMMDTRIKTETVQGDDGKDHHRNIPRITYTLIKEGVNLPPPEVVAGVPA